MDTDTQLPSHPHGLSIEEQKLLQFHQTLKLKIERVPRSCSWSKVNKKVPRKYWDIIKKATFQKANNVCEICRGIGKQIPLMCHEVWEYDDTLNIQRLSHFQALCPPCYAAIHFKELLPRSGQTASTRRFMIINLLNQKIATKIIRTVHKQFIIRSTRQWKLDIEHLREFGLNPDDLLNQVKKDTLSP